MIGRVDPIPLVLNVHPNCNLDHPIDDILPFAGAVAEDAELRAALSHSFGFGGINTAMVLTRG